MKFFFLSQKSENPQLILVLRYSYLLAFSVIDRLLSQSISYIFNIENRTHFSFKRYKALNLKDYKKNIVKSGHYLHYFRVHHQLVCKLLSKSTLTRTDQFFQSIAPVTIDLARFLRTYLCQRFYEYALRLRTHTAVMRA